jgi:hypothetical protein
LSCGAAAHQCQQSKKKPAEAGFQSCAQHVTPV